MKTITILLFSIFSLSSMGYETEPGRAEVAIMKFEAMKIGKLLPSCNLKLRKNEKVMPSPAKLKEKFKAQSRAAKLLQKAEFSFKGGEDPSLFQKSDFKLIIFKEYGIYLAGDGAVRELK